jgi:hypothetical protein
MLALLAAFTAIAFQPVSPVHAAPTVDQSQTGGAETFGIFADGQTFKPAKHSVVGIDIEVNGRGGTVDIPDIATICINAYVKTSLNGTVLSDAAGENKCWTESLIDPNDNTLREVLLHIDFDPPAFVTPGTTYALVFTTTSDTSGFNGFNFRGSDLDPYPDGSFIDANDQLDPNDDIYFKTYYEPKFEDDDNDGVCNDATGFTPPHCSGKDLCPDTPAAERPVDGNGCSQPQIDQDLDGVCDAGKTSAAPAVCSGSDSCPDTPPAERPVDANGCSKHQVDEDLDGVCDPGKTSSLCTGSDQCPGTAAGAAVDSVGCPPDQDGDGLCETGGAGCPPVLDACPNTPPGVPVNARGCSAAQVTALQPVDSDLDGICNHGVSSPLCHGSDNCSSTPLSGGPIDSHGCSKPQVDADGDGVCNRGISSSLCTGSDNCSNTASGAQVDGNGCSKPQVDSDGDGVCNRGVTSPNPHSQCSGSDNCPGTPAGSTVNGNGCTVIIAPALRHGPALAYARWASLPAAA